MRSERQSSAIPHPRCPPDRQRRWRIHRGGIFREGRAGSRALCRGSESRAPARFHVPPADRAGPRFCSALRTATRSSTRSLTPTTPGCAYLPGTTELRHRRCAAPVLRRWQSYLRQEKAQPQRQRESSLLSEFSRDLTQAAMDTQLDPLVGREGELERVVQILCRRTKNNPVLIGEPGVGKTAIVEGLAQRIADGEVPSFLADKRILALDLSLIVAGTKYRGQFEERLKTIMKELMESQNCVIFIDELHTLVGAGSAEGSLDAANILKPALSRGEIQCIGATTPGEYRKSIEKDRSLERRFQAVK